MVLSGQLCLAKSYDKTETEGISNHLNGDSECLMWALNQWKGSGLLADILMQNSEISVNRAAKTSPAN